MYCISLLRSKMCNCDYLERPEVYEENEHRAKKLHQCSECGSTINPGSMYIKISGLWEGKWQHFKQCLHCNEIGDRLSQETKCPYEIGGLYEELIEGELISFDKASQAWISNTNWLKILTHQPLQCALNE